MPKTAVLERGVEKPALHILLIKRTFPTVRLMNAISGIRIYRISRRTSIKSLIRHYYLVKGRLGNAA